MVANVLPCSICFEFTIAQACHWSLQISFLTFFMDFIGHLPSIMQILEVEVMQGMSCIMVMVKLQ